jgi:integrase
MTEAVESLLRDRRERLGNPPRNAHVFTNDEGRPWDADDLSQWFRRLRARANIAEKEGENLVLYSSRHTRLTELAGDVNPHLLQKLAGHTSFATTLRYLHVPGEEVRDAVEEADRKRQSSDEPK